MNWSLIKTFGKVKYFNISYAVLFLVPFLVDFYNIIISKEIGITEFPFRLKILYSASLLYALGIAIYQFFCPNIIKKFENDYDYVNSYLDIDKELFPDKKYDIVISNLSEAQEDLKTELINLRKLIDSNPNDFKNNLKLEKEIETKISTVYTGCVARYLLNEYEGSKSKNRVAIVISGIFYILGTLALLALIFEKSYKVLIA